MTTPVVYSVQSQFHYPGEGPYRTSNVHVSFFVPHEFQRPYAPPPRPVSKEMKLLTFSRMTVAVLSFGGLHEEDAVVAHADDLRKCLSRTQFQYDHEDWFYATYDDPIRPSSRINEVWIEIFDAVIGRELLNSNCDNAHNYTYN